MHEQWAHSVHCPRMRTTTGLRSLVVNPYNIAVNRRARYLQQANEKHRLQYQKSIDVFSGYFENVQDVSMQDIKTN